MYLGFTECGNITNQSANFTDLILHWIQQKPTKIEVRINELPESQ